MLAILTLGNGRKSLVNNRHCLVKLCRCAAVERLMGPVRIVLVNEPLKPAPNTGRTAVPGRIEAVRSLFERLEPPLNVVPPAVFDLIALS